MLPDSKRRAPARDEAARGPEDEASGGRVELAPTPSSPSFRTKTGVCRIEAEQLLVLREGGRGALAQRLIGESIWRVLLVYGLVGAFLLGAGAWLLSEGKILRGSLLAALGYGLLRAAIRSRHNTAASRIPRAQIERIEAQEPRRGVTRGYFTVHYRVGDALKRRLIMLPGTLAEGEREYRRAREIFEREGWLEPKGAT
ncbi:MAG: hypothetical protein OEY14_03385 [Myxococcales bacterium]|nr:hypothetical protein [Myxococcales bacterium]